MKKNGSCGGTISPFHGRTKAMTMEVERMVVNTNTVMQMACTEMVILISSLKTVGGSSPEFESGDLFKVKSSGRVTVFSVEITEQRISNTSFINKH